MVVIPIMPRRLVITVCPREPGVVALPVERGTRVRRLDARAILASLQALVARAGVGDRVAVREACAGGCSGVGPNVSVAIYSMPAAGTRADQVATGWKTYVYSLSTLDCLAQVIEDNLDEPRQTRARPPIMSGRRRSARAAPSATRRGVGSPRR
jgi:hypothetical protein